MILITSILKNCDDRQHWEMQCNHIAVFRAPLIFQKRLCTGSHTLNENNLTTKNDNVAPAEEIRCVFDDI